MSAQDKINAFMKSDTEKVAEIIEKYPKQIPVKVVAELLGCNADSVRRALEQYSLFGFGLKQAGAVNRAFVIPTGVFIRWYLKIPA